VTTLAVILALCLLLVCIIVFVDDWADDDRGSH